MGGGDHPDPHYYFWWGLRRPQPPRPVRPSRPVLSIRPWSGEGASPPPLKTARAEKLVNINQINQTCTKNNQPTNISE